MRIFGYKPPFTAWVGIFIVGGFVFVAIFAPWIAPYSESDSVADTWSAPSAAYLLGTDNIGRDLLSRVMYGARTTIGVALMTTILSFLLGTVMGIWAAVGGRVVDQVLSRIVDVMLSIPLLVFALIILSMFGSSLVTLILTIAVLDSTRVFRLARAVAMNLVVLEYVEAARLRGEGLWWIIRREILPNALPPMISEFGLRFHADSVDAGVRADAAGQIANGLHALRPAELQFHLLTLGHIIQHEDAAAAILAGTLVTIVVTALTAKRRDESLPLELFLKGLKPGHPTRVKGTALFLTADVDKVPISLLHNLKHNKVLHERTVLMSIKTLDIPRASPEERLEVRHFEHDIHTVAARYGFFEEPDIWRALGHCQTQGLEFNLMETSVFVGREKLVISNKIHLAKWRKELFALLFRLSLSAVEFFRVPSNRVVELGGQTEF